LKNPHFLPPFVGNVEQRKLLGLLVRESKKVALILVEAFERKCPITLLLLLRDSRKKISRELNTTDASRATESQKCNLVSEANAKMQNRAD
jgi:hypothetical protein